MGTKPVPTLRLPADCCWRDCRGTGESDGTMVPDESPVPLRDRWDYVKRGEANRLMGRCTVLFLPRPYRNGGFTNETHPTGSTAAPANHRDDVRGFVANTPQERAQNSRVRSPHSLRSITDRPAGGAQQPGRSPSRKDVGTVCGRRCRGRWVQNRYPPYGSKLIIYGSQSHCPVVDHPIRCARSQIALRAGPNNQADRPPERTSGRCVGGDAGSVGTKPVTTLRLPADCCCVCHCERSEAICAYRTGS